MFRKYGKYALLAAAAALFVPALSAAQDQAAVPGLASAVSSDYGPHLVTGDGRALYLYIEDADGSSACDSAACIRNWPPLLVEAGSDIDLGDGIDASLVGTIERADGTTQVTYAGHPVYLSRHDAPGDTFGQRIARGSFLLVSLSGDAITEVQVEEVAEVDEATLAGLVATGEVVYRNSCAACHGDQAQGGVGPGLADSAFVGNDGPVITQILEGFPDHGMPAFRDILDDHQVAGLLTFVRSNFGNEYGPILEEDVAALR